MYILGFWKPWVYKIYFVAKLLLIQNGVIKNKNDKNAE